MPDTRYALGGGERAPVMSHNVSVPLRIGRTQEFKMGLLHYKMPHLKRKYFYMSEVTRHCLGYFCNHNSRKVVKGGGDTTHIALQILEPKCSQRALISIVKELHENEVRAMCILIKGQG